MSATSAYPTPPPETRKSASSSFSCSRSAATSSTHSPLASMAARFIHSLFQCPLEAAGGAPSLESFVAYTLYRTQLPPSVTLSALVLLHRLKTHFPSATGSAGQRLFLAAMMLSAKSIQDDTFANSSWVIVSRNQFTLREVNQMERELFHHLSYSVVVDQKEIETLIRVLSSTRAALPPSPKAQAAAAAAYPSPPVTPCGSAACSPAGPSDVHPLPSSPQRGRAFGRS